MRQYPKVRASDTTLCCIACGAEKEVKDFPPAGQYKDGTQRYRARCRTCCNQLRRVQRHRGTKDRIMGFEAPVAAAIRLMRKKPEVLAEIARRYHFEYIPLLQEEREKMMATHKRHCQAMSELHEREPVLD